ncbi:hypothetical protein [Brevibacillus laterosporus]|uniref:hypothetical protein n=1 Tax=Brevibacillus laterosporus TaxID=1465 RepID=UPI000E6CA6CB|nr:hypothetical protein [Brevibacillus laterosporus]AYB38514.1 hypothetical protein D5F52_09725 [Brevibacillus laterosporus]MBM7111475.1 hypothetical protein [Brevibacillus laterosporus]
MNRNVEVRVLSYKIEQGIRDGKLILELDFDNPFGDIQEYAKFVDAFHTFLKEKGYATHVIRSAKSDVDVDGILSKISESLEKEIANSTQRGV